MEEYKRAQLPRGNSQQHSVDKPNEENKETSSGQVA